MSRWEVQLRKRITVNTDPQRRCYWGVNAREESYWTEWEHFIWWDTKELAEACAKQCQNEPPHGREYRVMPEKGGARK